MKLTPLTVFASVILAAGCTGQPVSQAANANADAEDAGRFVGRVYDESGNLREPAPLPKVVKTTAQWEAQLEPDQYRILREHGTERPFTGELLANSAAGVYRCAGCDLPLYASDTKFKSGTGWPSFYQAIADGNVGERTDQTLGMVRTEIHCGRCEGHLGHVFRDGPAPTGLRHCVNALSLEFTPIEDIATLAEPVDVSASVVLAGGCFWCVEAVFEELAGVKEAVSGYAGGTAESANYGAVSSGRTMHAEAVRIIYDPSKISYDELLRVHFATHDPTTLNRQGADVGPQYRSAIFYTDEAEKTRTRAFIADLGEKKVFDQPVVTALEPLTEFYPAEQYHQDYVRHNPSNGYVRNVSWPKVRKVRKKFGPLLKDKSPLD